MIKETFGRNLKRLRKEKHLTQEQLAEKVNMNSRQISKIETGEHFPTWKNIENICKALEITHEELFILPDTLKIQKGLPLNTQDKKTDYKAEELIRNLPLEENVCAFLIIALRAIYHKEEFDKLEILVRGMKLAKW